MQVLVALARRRGAVVPRDELVSECWAGRVVGDDAISRCIIRLRRVAEKHGGFAVETIPRVGYRLTENEAEAGVRPPPESAESLPPSSSVSSPNRHWIAVAFAAVVVFALAAGLLWWRANQARAAQQQVLDRVVELVANDRLAQAFAIARPLSQDDRMRRDTRFESAWRQIVLPTRPIVAEPGATVYFKPYDDSDGPWLEMGTTPLSSWVEAPRGQLRLKVEKPGFRTAYFAVANPGVSVENPTVDPYRVNQRISSVPLPLAREDAIPTDVVVVPATNAAVALMHWTVDVRSGQRHSMAAFAIDRKEVTNREYKEFVDAGGYEDERFWRELTFEAQGRVLSWREARERFVDSTGRPGPAGWRLSAYPSDAADLPVGGISWYEAAAYAKFRGRQLPTVHHWIRAAFAPHDERYNLASAVALASNFSSNGPRKAVDQQALGPWGTLDMAGNVREWVWNSADGKGMALGGAWTDYVDDQRIAYTADRMQRAPEDGVRLMTMLAGDSMDPELLKPISLGYVDATVTRAPVADDVFAAMRMQFDQVRSAPTQTTVNVVARSPLWIAEEVILEFAHEPPATLYVVRPSRQLGKLQPIIYAPAQNCCIAKRPNRQSLENLQIAEFVVTGGRALVIPVWMGSYERYVPLDPDPKSASDGQRRAAQAWRQDLGIALDYLAMRDDMDVQRAGFLGVSRGAAFNVLAVAIEQRIKAAVLVSGGIEIGRPLHPMIDLVNYAPRIRMPVLMINGRFDHIYAFHESQERLFALLGTAPEQKRHIVHDTGHFDFPPNSTVRDATDWWDRYLGPVR